MKLDGLRVLDLSMFLPGPHLTMMMADHGAEVIMIEPANGRGEPTRAMGERYTDGTSVWFANIARGKKSYTVNLKDEGEHAQFLERVRAAAARGPTPQGCASAAATRAPSVCAL